MYVFALGCAPDPGNHYPTQNLREDTENQSGKGLVLLDHGTDGRTEAQLRQEFTLGHTDLVSGRVLESNFSALVLPSYSAHCHCVLQTELAAPSHPYLQESQE